MKGLDARMTQGLAAVIAAVVTLLSWSQGYHGAVRAYQTRQEQMKTLRIRLDGLERMVGNSGGPITWLAHAQQRLVQLKARFPRQGQLPDLLNTLVETLRAGEMKLVNVSQDNLEPVQDGDQPLLIEGAPCYQLPVSVSAEGRYHDVLAALGRLSSDAFPAVVSFEHVELRRKDASGPILDATIRLFLYVVGAPPPASAPTARRSPESPHA